MSLVEGIVTSTKMSASGRPLPHPPPLQNNLELTESSYSNIRITSGWKSAPACSSPRK